MAKKPRRMRSTSVDQPQLTAEQQFQQEYAYVIKDLRHIFILAGIMFVVLITLNLILQS